MLTPATFSDAEFRNALGTFATGVTVITARGADGRAVGLTASSFNSVSIKPALVLWSLGLKAGSLATFKAASHYAIHVLQADQSDLAMRFSRQSEDRFAGLALREGLGGAPLLDGAAAVFECRNHHQHAEGDHIIFVGEVQRLQHVQHAQPLLYHGGKFYTELPLALDGKSTESPLKPSGAFVDHYLSYLLGQANHRIYKGFEAHLAQASLSHIEWRVLAVLHAKKPKTITELGHAILAKQPTVTKLIQRMHANGWVSMESDPGDQRKSLIHATAQGQTLATSLIRKAKLVENEQLARLTAVERESLKGLLKKLVC